MTYLSSTIALEKTKKTYQEYCRLPGFRFQSKEIRKISLDVLKYTSVECSRSKNLPCLPVSLNKLSLRIAFLDVNYVYLSLSLTWF